MILAVLLRRFASGAAANEAPAALLVLLARATARAARFANGAIFRAIALATLSLIFAPAPANAVATCSLSSPGVVFGAFSGSQLTTTSQITIHCSGTGTSNYQLKLSTGNSGTYASRQMKNGTNTLSYNLYVDPANTNIWGDGTGGSTFASGQIKVGPPPTVDIVVPLYGKLPAQALPVAGLFLDTIVATLTCVTGGNCTTTTSFTVTANEQSVCTISATDLAFGTYFQAQLDAQSQISLHCSNLAPWNVGLNQGTFPGATVTTRRMTGGGGSSLGYSLYRDPARTLNWGNTPGTDTISGTGTGTTQALSVYGRVPASQAPLVPGGYQDTIIVTITY